MEVDLLLILGLSVVSFVCGVSMAESTPTPQLTETAKLLGELHVAHAKATAAKDEVSTKLSAYIDRLKQIFSLE